MSWYRLQRRPRPPMYFEHSDEWHAAKQFARVHVLKAKGWPNDATFTACDAPEPRIEIQRIKDVVLYIEGAL